MVHTMTGMLALGTVLVLLLARRCERSAVHRGCARRHMTCSAPVPRGADPATHHRAASPTPVGVSVPGRPG